MDHLVVQLEKDLDELTLLKGYVENESLLFHKLHPFAPALSKFINIVRSIISEISSVRDNLDSLLNNKTQAKFVELLRPILGNLGADIEIVNYILNEHLTTSFHIRIYPSFVYAFWESMGRGASMLINCCINCRLSGDEPFASSFPANLSDQINVGTSDTTPSNSLSQAERSTARRPSLSLPISLSQSQKRLPSKTIEETLFAGLQYFDTNSRSKKIKSMVERRKFYQTEVNLHDEEKLFLPSSCGGCEAFDRTVHSDERDAENHSGVSREKVSVPQWYLPIQYFLFL